ncbi:MAG: hypothetical protein JWO09_118 [Bacteroidetes bacterium]|nr:hypothetical protein [Bacteroidota bacterium]
MKTLLSLLLTCLFALSYAQSNSPYVVQTFAKTKSQKGYEVRDAVMLDNDDIIWIGQKKQQFLMQMYNSGLTLIKENISESPLPSEAVYRHLIRTDGHIFLLYTTKEDSITVLGVEIDPKELKINNKVFIISERKSLAPFHFMIDAYFEPVNWDLRSYFSNDLSYYMLATNTTRLAYSADNIKINVLDKELKPLWSRYLIKSGPNQDLAIVNAGDVLVLNWKGTLTVYKPDQSSFTVKMPGGEKESILDGKIVETRDGVYVFGSYIGRYGNEAGNYKIVLDKNYQPVHQYFYPFPKGINDTSNHNMSIVDLKVRSISEGENGSFYILSEFLTEGTSTSFSANQNASGTRTTTMPVRNLGDIIVSRINNDQVVWANRISKVQSTWATRALSFHSIVSGDGVDIFFNDNIKNFGKIYNREALEFKYRDGKKNYLAGVRIDNLGRMEKFNVLSGLEDPLNIKDFKNGYKKGVLNIGRLNGIVFIKR